MITVWYESHYNKFSKTFDLDLTCDDPRWPIVGVYADDLKDADEWCRHFLGESGWQLCSAG